MTIAASLLSCIPFVRTKELKFVEVLSESSPSKGLSNRHMGASAERENPGLLGDALTRHSNLGAAKFE